MSTKSPLPRIILVGVGRWGKNHARILLKLGFLAGVVDIAQVPESVIPGHIARFSDLESAITKVKPSGCIIASPAQLHYVQARTLLQHKIPTLVEKPLALSASEASDLCALSLKSSVPLMVGHLLLFHPAIRKIRALLDEGAIGTLRYIYSNRLNLGIVRTEENILWSFAPHDIAIFQFLLGKMPTSVKCSGSSHLQPHIHDSTLMSLQYPGNISAHIFVSWLHPFKEHRIVLIGSKGMLSYEDSAPAKELKFYKSVIDIVDGMPLIRKSSPERISFQNSEPLEEELTYFINNLHNPELQICSAKSGLEVLKILDMATNDLLGSDLKINTQHNSSVKNYSSDVYVHPSSVVDQGVTIGAGTKVWHFSHIQTGAKIGTSCSIGQNVNIATNVSIGNNVKIQNNVSVYEGVTLEDGVFCGPSAVFTNILTPRSFFPRRGSNFYLKTLVKEGASLGANSTILCGITIGCHAMIAAAATVTKDVPDFALVKGTPAKQTGWACMCGETLKKRARVFRCGECARVYRVVKRRMQLVAQK